MVVRLQSCLVLFIFLAFIGSKAAEAMSLRETVAYAWAPLFFKDFAHEFTNTENGFNPVDHPLHLFFDGNEDVRDNHKKVFTLDNELQKKALKNTPVFYSVIETSTHYYINYFLYHAVDLKKFGHAHDTENVWTIVEKNESPYGSLVMHVTNAHGYPMIYGSNLTAQKFWRNQVNKKEVFRFLKEMDRFAGNHHNESFVEYVERAVSKSIKLFVSSKTHAIYKLNSKSWQSGKGYGSIYFPRSCLECQTEAESHSRVQAYEYELVSWDDFFFKHRDSIPKVFVKQNKKPARRIKGLKILDLPDHLSPARGEMRARVNLFHGLTFKTPFPLAFPAKMHSWLSGSRNGISQNYLHNPYIERVDESHRSSWSLISDFASGLGEPKSD